MTRTVQAKRTIAIFCDGGFLAHVTRSLEVGRALHYCFGHRVIFGCSGPYAHIPRDAGFEVAPVYTVDRDTTMDLARRFGLCSLRWWKAACTRSVESDLEVMEALRPDAVVGDMRWSLSTSARVYGVPYVAMANACWTSRFAVPIDLPDEHFLGKILGRSLASAMFPALFGLMQKYYALGHAEVRKRYGLPPLRVLFDAIEGDITLLPDVPEFMPVVRDTPPSFRYTGPILWDANVPLPAWFSRLQSDRPTVYFTMGSTGDSKFFAEAVRVFGDSEYQVLITTGGLAEIPHTPRNVFMTTYAPGEMLVARSDVVVSHGGNGTVYQALSRGVPVIGFPTIFDQEINMRRVCAMGAGIQMSRARHTGSSLRSAVDHVLYDSRYRERCQWLAMRISQMDGRRQAALHIDDFLEHRDPVRHPKAAKEALESLPALPAQIAVA